MTPATDKISAITEKHEEGLGSPSFERSKKINKKSASGNGNQLKRETGIDPRKDENQSEEKWKSTGGEMKLIWRREREREIKSARRRYEIDLKERNENQPGGKK